MIRSTSLITPVQRNDYQTAVQELSSLAPELRFRPLAHFLRPSDPCVPKQLLGLSLDEVANIRFDDLLRFSGVGPVKITNLSAVLRRIVTEPREESAVAAAAETAAVPAPLWNEIPAPPSAPLIAAKPSGAYAEVDELLWEHWCLRIRRYGLGRETLGRCVARLRDLPRSLWYVPVEDFLYVSYGELFRLRGFGVKRVAAIVEVFRALDAAITVAEQAEAEGRPAVAPVACPPLVAELDAAVSSVVIGRFAWLPKWFAATVVGPIWEQLQVDADETTCALVAERLGFDAGPLPPHVGCELWASRARIASASCPKPPRWCRLAGRRAKNWSVSCWRSPGDRSRRIRPTIRSSRLPWRFFSGAERRRAGRATQTLAAIVVGPVGRTLGDRPAAGHVALVGLVHRRRRI